MVSEGFELQTFDRGEMMISLAYFLALHEDEYERYSDNPILPIPLETAMFHRTYLGNKRNFSYLFPRLKIQVPIDPNPSWKKRKTAWH